MIYFILTVITSNLDLIFCGDSIMKRSKKKFELLWFRRSVLGTMFFALMFSIKQIVGFSFLFLETTLRLCLFALLVRCVLHQSKKAQTGFSTHFEVKHMEETQRMLCSIQMEIKWTWWSSIKDTWHKPGCSWGALCYQPPPDVEGNNCQLLLNFLWGTKRIALSAWKKQFSFHYLWTLTICFF